MVRWPVASKDFGASLRSPTNRRKQLHHPRKRQGRTECSGALGRGDFPRGLLSINVFKWSVHIFVVFFSFSFILGPMNLLIGSSPREDRSQVNPRRKGVHGKIVYGRVTMLSVSYRDSMMPSSFCNTGENSTTQLFFGYIRILKYFAQRLPRPVYRRILFRTFRTSGRPIGHRNRDHAFVHFMSIFFEKPK